MGMFGCGGSQDAPPASGPIKTPTVSVVAAIQTNMPLRLEALGHATPFSSIAIRSQVGGLLEGVHFKEGDRLRAGDLLFSINSRPFLDALTRATNELAKDLSLQKQAASEQAANAILLRSKAVSQDIYNESQADADSLKAAVEADRAAADLAELDLSCCQIRSPIDGRAGLLQVNAGTVIPGADTVLVTVNQTQPIFVDFPVPEQNLADIRRLDEHQPIAVQARLAGQPTWWTGELSAIDNAVDENTHAVMLRARFANEAEALWPGQTVNVRVVLPTLTSATLVPLEAVRETPTGAFVFIVNQEEILEHRSVEKGEQIGATLMVCRGVCAGERVVVRGHDGLAAGLKVKALW